MRKIFLILSITTFTVTTSMSNITRETAQDTQDTCLESIKNIIIPPISFYFVRHGQTDWNKEHKVMGQTDIPLNDTGIKQAQIVAQHIAHLDIVHIVSSPLKRTTQTAEIIANTINKPIVVVNELTECCMGIMEGQDKGDGAWFDNWMVGCNIDGAESWPDFVSRIAVSLNQVLTNHVDEKPILIVAHRPTFWALLSILNIQDDLNAENCDIYFFRPSDLDSQQWKVVALNCLE